jgi:hypothetical protein
LLLHAYATRTGNDDLDVMAVPLTVDGATLMPGRPVTVFREPSLKTNNSLFFYGGAAGYDVTLDGKTSLVIG